MELRLGPFDPTLHVRSRDHYEAVRREAQLSELGGRQAVADLDELLARMAGQLGTLPVDDAADRAFLAGESSFTAILTVPDDQAPSILSACDVLERLLLELDRWVCETGANLLDAPDDVKRYRRACIDQIREQLQSPAVAG